MASDSPSAGASTSEPNIDIMNDPAYVLNPDHSAEDLQNQDPDHCRICRSEGSPEEPLFHPCKCSGSIKFVHQDCLMEWLQHSQKKYCELCKTPFTFTKVYDPDMPPTLPTPLFLRQLTRRLARGALFWARAVLVAFVWLGCLPWCVRWMWRGWFWLSDGGWWQLPHTGTSFTNLQATQASVQPSAISTCAAMEGRGIISFLSSPGLSQPMSPVNGFPARSIQAPRTSLGLALYPDGIFFDHNPFYNATRLRVVNTMIADVLEGQLLTAIIVVSFIIVFLIKEWVVQQQPAMAGDAADMPLLNEQEPFVAPPADPAPAALHDPGVLDPAEALAGPANEEDYENWMGRAFEGQDNPPVDTDGAQATPENAQVDGAAEAPEQRVFAQPRPRRRHGGAEMIENNSNPEVDNDAIQEGEGVSTGFNFAEMQRPTPTRESTAQVLTLRRDLEETNRVGGANTPYDFGGTKSSTDNLFQFGGANPEPTRPQTMWERDSPAVPAEATNNMDTIDTGRTAAWMRDNVASGSGVPVVAERRMSDITGLNDDTTDKSGSASWASTSSFEFVSGPVDKGKSPERPLSTEIIEHSHVEEILAEGNTESTENDEGEAGPSEDITTEIKGKESVESGEAQVDAYSEDITVESKGKEIFESGDAQYSEDEGESRAEGSVGFGTSEWSTIAQAGDTPVPSDVSATPPPMVDPLDYYERRRGTDLPDNARIELERLNNERRIDEIRNRIRLRNQPAHDHVQNQDWANRAPHGPAPPRHDEAENREQPLQIEAPAVQAEDNVRRGGLLDWIIGEDEPDVANRQGIDAEDTDDEDNQLAAGALPQPILDDDAADDFEGIMELVGMRGPLLGLVQNAAISSMLITATVAVGVAFPYVVGKTVMMILAHPILFFFRLPGLAISFCAEFLVDTATMIGFSLLLFLDQVAKFFLEPLSFIAPSLSSDAITNFLKNWATDGQNRVFAKFTSIETTYLAIRKYPPSAVPPLSLVIREALMRLLQSTKWGLGKLGIFRLVPATISAGPAAFDLKVVNVTNPVAWAVHTWDGTLAAVNFTKPSNISAADAIAQFEHHLSHPYDGVYKWSALDRIGVVLLGYAFFTMVGMIYVRKRRSEQASNIERLLVEFLQQCGGVMKVVLIIGIEMFVFPLYCGVLLDIAMLPLFETATIVTRIQFAVDFPFTNVFVHWFVGTCYMFHFALFVSMCRKIMRTGVLYFIRDPDDPTFHPVRDVLNRPVVTQLRKIGFSAFIYGVLVLVCLGGVVWGLFSTTKGVLPIHWSSNEPVFEFPVDLLFYNFLMPLAVKFFKPSDGLQTMYDWWFKRSARVLRLTSFMFGERQKDEEGYICYPNWLSFLLRQRPDFENPVLEGQEAPVGQLYFQRDGRFVRAPASDSVRKHKGSNIFIPVDEFNRRLDVDPSQDPPNGPTGSNSPDWRLAYIPPYFRVRLALVAVGVWFFAALTGVSITIGPLILGRHLLRHLVPETVRLNDIYAFSIGIYVLGGAALVLAKAPAAFGFLKALTGPLTAAASKSSYIEKFKKVGISTHELVLRMAKIGYIITAFAIVIPTLVAMIIEFYFIIPLHTAFNASLAAEAAGNVLASNTTAIAETAARVDIAAAAAETPAHMAHTIHFVQDWTLGVLYVKMMGKMLLLDETSVWARSLRGIIAHGWLNPDAKLATRVFIAPCVGGMVAALLIPLVGARCAIAWGVTEDAKVYRYAFPVVMAGALVGALLYAAWRVVEGWKEGVRDEVYLRGMRIHNHGEEAGVEKLPRRRARAASAAL